MATRRRKWIIAGTCVLAAGLLGTAYFDFTWMIDRSRYALHEPGTYYFVSFTGPWQPFRPVDEISRDQAMARRGHVIGIFNDLGQLAVIEKHSRGAVFFRYEYRYDSDGKLFGVHGGQEGGLVRTQRFDGSSN